MLVACNTIINVCHIWKNTTTKKTEGAMEPVCVALWWPEINASSECGVCSPACWFTYTHIWFLLSAGACGKCVLSGHFVNESVTELDVSRFASTCTSNHTLISQGPATVLINSFIGIIVVLDSKLQYCLLGIKFYWLLLLAWFRFHEQFDVWRHNSMPSWWHRL